MPWLVAIIWAVHFAHPLLPNDAHEKMFANFGLNSACLVSDPQLPLWVLQSAEPKLVASQRGVALNAIARCLLVLGDWPGAYDAYDEALLVTLDLGHDPGHVEKAIQIVTDYASLTHEHSAWPLAETLLQQGIDLAKTINNREQVACLSHQLACLAEERQDLRLAVQAYKQSLAQWQALRQEHRVAANWQQIALLQQRYGQYGDAHIAINRAIHTTRSHDGNIAPLLVIRGNLQHQKGDWASAERDFTQALHIYKSHHQSSGIAQANVGLAKVMLQTDQLTQANGHLRKALAIYESQGDRPNQAITHLLLGDVALRQRNIQRALREYADANNQAERLSNPQLHISVQLALGQANQVADQLAAAEACYRNALKVADTASLPFEKQRAAGKLSEIYAGTNRWQEAHHYQLEASNILNDLLTQATQTPDAPIMDAALTERTGEQRTFTPSVKTRPLQNVLWIVTIILISTGVALWYVRDLLFKRIGLKLTESSRHNAEKARQLETTNLRLLERTEEVTRINRELYHVSVTDALTGAHNRSYLVDFLRRELSNCRRHGLDMAFFMVDLDYFKKVNDTYGHLCGDQVLRQTVKLIQGQVRAEDLIARFGGEEFMVVLPNTNRNRAMRVAEKVRQAVEEHPFKCDESVLHISISIGVSDWQSCHATSVNDLIRCADQALYEAKRAGRNQTILFHE